MRIRTELIINASKEKVWEILTDLESYPQWNPFIIKSEGKVVQGIRLKNTLKNGEGSMVFRPRVLQVDPNRYFDWLGSLWFKGLFDGHHYFEIQPVKDNQVKLIHGENFSGILKGPILKKIGHQTRENFVKMNIALKDLAERADIKV
jgi:hypothetical protein